MEKSLEGIKIFFSRIFLLIFKKIFPPDFQKNFSSWFFLLREKSLTIDFLLEKFLAIDFFVGEKFLFRKKFFIFLEIFLLWKNP